MGMRNKWIKQICMDKKLKIFLSIAGALRLSEYEKINEKDGADKTQQNGLINFCTFACN